MKKTLYIAAIAALFTLSSCQKGEVANKDNYIGEDPVFTATIAPNGTRTNIDLATGIVTWDGYEEIDITDAAGKTVGYKVSAVSEDGRTATITKKDTETKTLGAGPYIAKYGADPLKTVHYNYGISGLQMIDTTETTTLEFKIACGVLEIRLKKAGTTITKIEVSNATDTYTLDCSNVGGVSIVDTAKFHISLPEGEYTKFTFTASDGKTCVKQNNASGVKLLANQIRPITFTNMLFFPADAIHGLFSVDADGTKVCFAKGNLQYLGTGTNGTLTPQWRIAEHQYDKMDKGPTDKQYPGNVSIDGYSTYNTFSAAAGGSETEEDKKAARDIFGWGTTGYKDQRAGASTYQTCYQPFSTNVDTVTSSPAKDKNLYGFGPDYDATTKYSLSVKDKSDWGCVIGDGKTWRTLSGGKDGEWDYILNVRTVNGGTGLGYAYENYRTDGITIEGITFTGLVLFPDGFTKQNTWKKEFTTWAQCNDAGLVFLPKTVFGAWSPSSKRVFSNKAIFYHSSTVENERNAYCLFITDAYDIANGFCNREGMIAVRLVSDIHTGKIVVDGSLSYDFKEYTDYE